MLAGEWAGLERSLKACLYPYFSPHEWTLIVASVLRDPHVHNRHACARHRLHALLARHRQTPAAGFATMVAASSAAGTLAVCWVRRPRGYLSGKEDGRPCPVLPPPPGVDPLFWDAGHVVRVNEGGGVSHRLGCRWSANDGGSPLSEAADVTAATWSRPDYTDPFVLKGGCALMLDTNAGLPEQTSNRPGEPDQHVWCALATSPPWNCLS